MLFKRSFMVLRGLTGYVTAWKNHFRRVLWHCARDGVGYAEIRIPMKWDNFVWRDDGEVQLTRREMVGLLKEVLEEEEPKIKAEGLVWWGVRFIYGSYRLAERENMKWMMDDAIDLKQAYPDLMCGKKFSACGPGDTNADCLRFRYARSVVDLSIMIDWTEKGRRCLLLIKMFAGQEDDGHSHLHWIEELLDFRARCDKLGLDYPFVSQLNALHTVSYQRPWRQYQNLPNSLTTTDLSRWRDPQQHHLLQSLRRHPSLHQAHRPRLLPCPSPTPDAALPRPRHRHRILPHLERSSRPDTQRHQEPPAPHPTGTRRPLHHQLRRSGLLEFRRHEP